MTRLLGFLLLCAVLPACVPDGEETVFTPIVEAEEVSEELPVNTFALTVLTAKFNYGYRHSAPVGEGYIRHHIVLTAGPVAEGEHLNGIGEGLSLVFTTNGTEITGEHHINQGAEPLRYFREADFSTAYNRANLEMESGTINITHSDERYTVEVDYYDEGADTMVRRAVGTFRGDLVSVSPKPPAPPSEQLLSEPEQWSVYDFTPEFEHAYLVSAELNHTLYLTENHVLTPSNQLSGVSDMMAIKFDGGFRETTTGFLINTLHHPDFLTGELADQRLSGNYCQEYHFESGAYTRDYATLTEVFLLWDGEELRVRPSSSNEGASVNGLYRGGMTIIN